LIQDYANRGSLAYPPEQLLPFVLFMYSRKFTSPAEWARQARYNDEAKWLLKGLKPSRSQFYTFRDRTEPFLHGLNRQLIRRAMLEKITTASRGALDGSFVAALASRHRLLSISTLDHRVVLLDLAVWVDDFPDKALAVLALAMHPLVWMVALAVPGFAEVLVLLLLLLLLHLDPSSPTNAALPGWLPRSVAGRLRMLERYEKAQQRLAERMEPYRDKKRLSKKDKAAIKRMKINPMDPEAVLGWDKLGTFRPLYNVQLVKATDSPLILAWDTVGRNNDQGLLRPMMEKTEEQLGHRLAEVEIDDGYVSITDLLWCENKKIVVYAPPEKDKKTAPAVAAPAAGVEPVALPGQQGTPQGEQTAAVASGGVAAVAGTGGPCDKGEEQRVAEARQTADEGRASASEPQAEKEKASASEAKAEKEVREKEASLGLKKGGESKGQEKEKKYGKEEFSYDKEKKVYYCPQGKQLKEVGRDTEKRTGGVELPVIVHRAEQSDCAGCSARQKCTTGKKGRVVKRYEGEEVLERLQQRMSEAASQKIYQERKKTVELGYADLKEHRGLRQFNSFGKKRGQAQVGLTILAHNALNIERILWRRQKERGPPDGPERG
jgi:hypothetical protein